MDWGEGCIIIRNVYAGQQTWWLTIQLVFNFVDFPTVQWRSDNDLGGGDVSRDVLYEPRGKVDLIRVVFSKYWSCIPSAIKIVLEAMNV